MKSVKTLGLAVSSLMLGTVPVGQDLPQFVERLLAEYEQEGAKLGEVWETQYGGETVYYLPKSQLCCDIMSELYDEEGHLICRPDGGIAGSGDGICPGFVFLQSAGVRIWPPVETEQGGLRDLRHTQMSGRSTDDEASDEPKSVATPDESSHGNSGSNKTESEQGSSEGGPAP